MVEFLPIVIRFCMSAFVSSTSLLIYFLFFQEELEAIKIKLEKVENDRTKLKYDNDKLEAKVSTNIVT